MVPAIRNILGGFLFSGDDVHKKAGVLSGGERTRLAVARMLLRPSNTLLLDEPTNHLDLDSKDVLLDALEDYGGTLIIVSHDRYFVEKLATKIIEIGHGGATVYPGTYAEFLWSKQSRERSPDEATGKTAPRPSAPAARPSGAKPSGGQTLGKGAPPPPSAKPGQPRHAAAPASDLNDRDARKLRDADRKKQQRAGDALRKRISELEGRIASRETEVKDLEKAMAEPGFFDDHERSKPVIDRHQALMWEVGDLMSQWEALQEHAVWSAPES